MVVCITVCTQDLGSWSSRQEYYIFTGPPCGIIFSENQKKILAINNLLSMKRSPDNQINAFSNWHLEN